MRPSVKRRQISSRCRLLQASQMCWNRGTIGNRSNEKISRASWDPADQHTKGRGEANPPGCRLGASQSAHFRSAGCWVGQTHPRRRNSIRNFKGAVKASRRQRAENRPVREFDWRQTSAKMRMLGTRFTKEKRRNGNLNARSGPITGRLTPADLRPRSGCRVHCVEGD
jgi:hypothetical protein